jgi:hypothetical protein
MQTEKPQKCVLIKIHAKKEENMKKKTGKTENPAKILNFVQFS